MALSQVLYNGDNSTVQFNVTFPYIEQSHVKVYIANVEDTSFTWVNSSRIQTSSTPAVGAVVKIDRDTPTDARLVDFADGSVLTESDLDKSANQNFYTVQENVDAIADCLKKDNSGLFDAGSVRIINVANPTANQDAVTKYYLENTWLSTTDKTNITTLSALSTELGLLGTSAVVTDLGILATADVVADLNTLGTSAIVEDLNILGTSDVVADMNTLATSAIVADLDVLADKVTEIGRLGTADAVADLAILATTDVVADLNTLATSAIVEDLNILGTADVVADMNTLATSDIVSDMNTLATSANVTAMGLLGNATTVTNMGLLGTSAVITDMGLLGTSAVIADMAQLATSDIIADMNTLATSDIIADLNTLATSDIVTDMNLLATSANVTAMGLLGVSGVITNMGLLGTSAVITDLGILGTSDVVADLNVLATSDVVTDMNVLGTSANVTAMDNCSGSIANINTVATNLSAVNNFGDVYRIASTAPTSSLTAGDLYFNTSTDILSVYGGSGWQNAGSSVNGTSQRYKYVATSNQTTFTGADANSATLSYDSGYIDVYLNGVHLDPSDFTASNGTSVVLGSGAATGDILYIVGFGTFNVASMNADNLSSGTIPVARYGTTVVQNTWESKSASFTAEASKSYFCDTTSNAIDVTLPSGTIGDEIRFLDVSGTFDTNDLTILYGSSKIQGVSANLDVGTERAGFALVYYNATQGWLLKDK